jgi:hypothetical protein
MILIHILEMLHNLLLLMENQIILRDIIEDIRNIRYYRNIL